MKKESDNIVLKCSIFFLILGILILAAFVFGLKLASDFDNFRLIRDKQITYRLSINPERIHK